MGHVENNRKGRCGRHRCTTNEEDRQIGNVSLESPFSSSSIIRQQLQINCSLHTIRRRLREHGQRWRKPARKPDLTERHAIARINFCVQNEHRNWNNVVFCDEKVFSSATDSPKVLWRPNNTRYAPNNILRTANSGRITAGFWGWMTAAGPGQLIRVSPPRFTAARYVEILENEFLAAARQRFPNYREEPIIFIHDNSPVHTARVVRQWFEAHPEFEILWGLVVKDWNDVGYHGVRERTVEQLTQHTLDVWGHIRPDVTTRLVESMPRRMQECRNNNGYYTKY